MKSITQRFEENLELARINLPLKGLHAHLEDAKERTIREVSEIVYGLSNRHLDSHRKECRKRFGH